VAPTTWEATSAVTGAFFEALAAAGVAHAVVSPGSRSAPLAVAALRAEATGLRLWPHAEERAAAFFALGLAKAGQMPVALLCTSGTAAASYLPALAEAYFANVPLVAITADRPPELRGWDPGQTIDQQRLYGPHVRWFAELPPPEPGEAALRHARAVARRAVATALGRHAGPVHLNWPLREPLSPPAEASSHAPAARRTGPPPPRAAAEPIARTPAPPPGEAEVGWLASLALRCPRGVLAAGPLDPEPLLAEAVAAFAAAAGWPVLADPASQLRCGPHVRGAPILASGDLLLRDAGFASAHAPQVVLRLGATPTSKALRGWLEASPPETLVLLDPDARWSDPSHLATHRLAVDPAALLAAAAARLAPRAESAWARAFARAEAAAQTALVRALDRAPELGEARAVREITALLPEGATLYASNSMPVRDVDAFLPRSERSLRVLVNRGANGIDGLCSSALGAAAAGGGPVVLLAGDLAFLHDLAGLAVAKRFGAKVLFAVLDNDGGGIFSLLPIAAHGEAVGFERLFRTPHGLPLERAGALFDLPATRARSWIELRAAVKEWLAGEGPAIVVLPIDRDANAEQFRALVADAGTAARGAAGAA
jgi:2-succinyl-5-enolpyruvyl-6-hydroxy-3-cyclohexene-1-carboxylate synthase